MAIRSGVFTRPIALDAPRGALREKSAPRVISAGVAAEPTSVRPVPKPPKEFKADRPFLFAIRHNPTGTVLFAGKVETV